MIQRIQTLFLLVVAALAAALFFVPVLDITTATPNMPVKEAQYMIQSNMSISAVVVLSGLIALITIFLYRNRQRQMMLCRLNILFIIGAFGLILQASDMSALPLSHDIITVKYLYAVWIPVVQFAFDLLAIRYIKKDDELVRSADRLR